MKKLKITILYTIPHFFCLLMIYLGYTFPCLDDMTFLNGGWALLLIFIMITMASYGYAFDLQHKEDYKDGK